MQKWPFGYHTLLRLVVFIASIYLAFLAMQAGQFVWMILFTILIILYNPIIPIHLKKDLWQIIEISGAAVFGISLFTLR
jgi:FtsH-binding integral membrane protein